MERVAKSMAIPVVEFSREGFLLKINCIQMILPNFENWSCQKLGIILENKMI
jgi:hypothetical protein